MKPWEQAAATVRRAPLLGVPINSVPQNVVGNLAGVGTVVAANSGVSVANGMAGLGTTEATIVAQVQGFFAQSIKHFPHFDEQHWLEPLMAIIGVPVAYFLHGGGIAAFDIVALIKSGITSIQGVKLAVLEYHSAQATVAAGMIKPVSPKNEYAQNPHLWPAPNSPGWGMTRTGPLAAAPATDQPVAAQQDEVTQPTPPTTAEPPTT